jgi:hypothetical protein
MLLCSVGAPALLNWQGILGNAFPEAVFRVKRRTKMSRLLDTYAAKIGVERYSFRTYFDGERCNDEDCPESVRGSQGSSPRCGERGGGRGLLGRAAGQQQGIRLPP